MPKIELEVTEEEISQIAKAGNVYGLTKQIVAQAEAYVEAAIKTNVLGQLTEELKNLEIVDKTGALQATKVLQDLHGVIEDRLSEIGLEYEIDVRLKDGRYLDLYDRGYSDDGWITSSSLC